MFHHDKLHQITNAHENNKYSVAIINFKTDKINITFFVACPPSAVKW